MARAIIKSLIKREPNALQIIEHMKRWKPEKVGKISPQEVQRVENLLRVQFGGREPTNLEV